MNGVRSTYMRKGYLLTALAAAVLLAASSGTASAQSVGFVGTSATMGEGASPAATTASPITVEIEISGLTLSGLTENREDGVGTLMIEHDADIAYAGQAERTGDNQRIWLDNTSSALDEAEAAVTALTANTGAGHSHLLGLPTETVLPYDNNGVIRLVIIDPDGDGNWVDDMFTMRLVTEAAEGDPIPPSPSPASYIVTVTDKDPQATVSFSASSLSLTEGSATASNSIGFSLTAGSPGASDDPARMGNLDNEVKFVASPAGAVVVVDADDNPDGCDPTHDRDVISLTLSTSITHANGTFTVTDPLGALTDAATFEVEACGDKSEFRDPTVTFSFVASSLRGNDDGADVDGVDYPEGFLGNVRGRQPVGRHGSEQRSRPDGSVRDVLDQHR